MQHACRVCGGVWGWFVCGREGVEGFLREENSWVFWVSVWCVVCVVEHPHSPPSQFNGWRRRTADRTSNLINYSKWKNSARESKTIVFSYFLNLTWVLLFFVSHHPVHAACMHAWMVRGWMIFVLLRASHANVRSLNGKNSKQERALKEGYLCEEKEKVALTHSSAIQWMAEKDDRPTKNHQKLSN